MRPLATATIALVAALLYAFGCYFLAGLSPGAFVSLSFLFGVPLAAGAIAVAILDPRGALSGDKHILIGSVVIVAIVLASIVVLREGGICTLMASPLLGAGCVLGALVTGNVLRRRAGRVLTILAVVLPVAGLRLETDALYPNATQIVSTSTTINASPRSVWPILTAVRDIQPSELGWTFTQDLVGVPKPLDARLAGHGIGAVRHVTWGKGIRFQERIVAWSPNRLLSWVFLFSKDSIPKTVEGNLRLDGTYLRIERGSYSLVAVPGARTRLTLVTRYWMRTPFNAYFAWWGRQFIGDFHTNVLRVIRERVEQQDLRMIRPDRRNQQLASEP